MKKLLVIISSIFLVPSIILSSIYYSLSNSIKEETIRESIKKELLTGIMNMFLHYYPKVDFEDDDYIQNIELCIYSSKETTEEEVRERLIKMLEDKED